MANTTYSFTEDTKAVAFIDILGFSNISLKASTEPLGDAGLAIHLFENCIDRNRSKMMRCFPREVPIGKHVEGQNFKVASVWHKEVPEGAVNFSYMSDCAVLYSNSLTHLFEIVSDIFGTAITRGVPLRGAIAMGALFHSESGQRPGTGICLYGDALTRAAILERAVHGAGMRVWLDPPVVELAKNTNLGAFIREGSCRKPAELKWWLQAYEPGGPRQTESAEMEWQFGRWFTEKFTRKWFKGSNCRHTKKVIALAVKELRALGR